MSEQPRKRNPKLRRHGEGTISLWKHSKGPGTKYQAEINITLPNGKSHKVTAYGPTPAKTLANRKRKVAEVMARHSGEERTLAEQSAEWLQWLKDQGRRDSTQEDYSQVLRFYILPVLGDRKLSTITPNDIETLQSSIIERVTRESTRGATGRRTANKVRKTLMAIFTHAERHELVERNPARPVPPIPEDSRKERLWTPTEIHRFLNTVRTGAYADPKLEAARSKHDGRGESWYSTLYYVALSMGLRIGELVALKWSDIRDGKLHIERAYGKAGNVWRIGPPKTPESFRVLPIGPDVQAALDEHRARLDAHIEQRKTNGSEWIKNDWIFPEQGGGLIQPSNPGRRLREYAAKAGVPGTTFHTLRKVFTTEFLRAGGSPKQAQYWLGHATHDMVMRIYGRLQQEQDLAAAVLSIDQLSGVDRTAVGTVIRTVKRGSKSAASQSDKRGQSAAARE